MNNKDLQVWEKRWERGLKIQKALDYSIAIGLPFEKTFGRGIYNWLCELDSKGATGIYNKADEWASFNEFYFKKFQDKSFFEIFENYEKLYQPHIGFLILVQKKDLSKLSNTDIIAYFLEYKKSVVQYFVPMWAVVVWEEVLERVAYEILKKYFNYKEVDSYAEIIFSLTKINYVFQEELDLYKISKLPKNKRESVFAGHVKKYEYMPMYDHDYDPFSRQYFLKRLNNISSKIIEDKKKQLKENKNKFIKLCKLSSLSDFDKKRLIIIHYLFNHKDQRSHYRSKESYLALPLYKEVAKRLGLSVKEVVFLTNDEIINLLNGEKAKVDISSRMKQFAFIYEKGDISILLGKEKEKYMKNNVQTLATDRIKGIGVSKGIAKGVVILINNIGDLSRVEKGNIMVTSMTRPEFVPAMRKCVAIVTDEGGMLSHAAIVSRELKIPCVVGMKYVTSKFKNGDRVEVDANKGVVKKI